VCVRKQRKSRGRKEGERGGENERKERWKVKKGRTNTARKEVKKEERRWKWQML
jgi:hypothetical protein